jgi:hypothetical protein
MRGCSLISTQMGTDMKIRLREEVTLIMDKILVHVNIRRKRVPCRAEQAWRLVRRKLFGFVRKNNINLGQANSSGER